MPCRQFIHDTSIDFSPCWRLIRHHHDGVTRIGQIEARVAQHWSRSVLIPPWMGAIPIFRPIYLAKRHIYTPGSFNIFGVGPVISRSSFLPYKAHPTLGALIVFGVETGSMCMRDRGS